MTVTEFKFREISVNEKEEVKPSSNSKKSEKRGLTKAVDGVYFLFYVTICRFRSSICKFPRVQGIKRFKERKKREEREKGKKRFK